MDYILEPALDVPGLEGIWEYNGLRINDLSALERLRVTDIGGLQDDPDLRETREPNADRAGEHAGIQQDGGRTLALSGVVEAGSIPSVRRLWRRARSAFDATERDLVIRVPQEVKNYYNSIESVPISTTVALQGWSGSITGTGSSSLSLAAVVDGLRTIGKFGFTSSGASILTARAMVANLSGAGVLWNGEDIFVTSRMKVAAAAATPTSISTSIYYFAAGAAVAIGSEISSSVIFNQNAPVTGTVYETTSRINGSAVPFGTVAFVIVVNFVVPATAGAYDYRFFDVGAFLLKSTDVAPKSYFDGDSPGFVWEGRRGWSRSFGPVAQLNGIPDVKTADIRDYFGTPTLWGSDSSAGATINQAPAQFRASGIIGIDKAIYMKATNPDATARTIAIKPDTTTTAVPMRAHPGRVYRAAYTVKIIQSATKAASIDLVWLDLAGAVLSTTSAAGSNSTSEQRLTVTGTAPARAVGVYARVSFAANGSGQVFEWSIAKPVIIDISDYDPGSNVDFSDIVDNPYVVQVKNANSYPAGSIRRIPRPWLIKSVRKADKPSSPEKQSDYRTRRDFMLTLRASDPRVYGVDAQSAWMAMPFGLQSTYESAQPTTPSPDTSPPLGLSTGVFTNMVNSDPTDLHFYQGPEGALRLRTTDAAVTGTRMDYGIRTSVIPWVRLRANPAMILTNPLGYGVVTIVLKRISNTSYIALDWVSVWNAPNTLTLYKVVAGTPTTLATATFASRIVPPNTYFMAWMNASNQISGRIYTTYPDTSIDALGASPFIDNALPIPVLSVDYTLTAGAEITTFGAAVAGRMGFGMQAGPPDPVNYPLPQNPGVFQYEAADGYANSRGAMMNIPVLGDFDEIPLQLNLTGGIFWPIVTITTPDGMTRSMAFKGLFGTGTSLPTVLDFDSNYFRDPNGIDMWDSILPFYDRLILQPGVNRVRVVASGWSGNQHVGVSWRNAVR